MKRKRSVKHVIIGVVITALIVSVSFTTARNMMVIREKLEVQMQAYGSTIIGQVIHNLENTHESQSLIDDLMNGKIEVALDSIKLMDVQMFENMGQLEENEAETSALDEFNVIAPSGQIVYSNIKGNMGQVLDKNNPAVQLFSSGDDQIIEDIRMSSTDNNYYKYGAIKKGNMVIQVGINANNYMDLQAKTNMPHMLANITKSDDIHYTAFYGINGEKVAGSDTQSGQSADEKVKDALAGQEVGGLVVSQVYGPTYEIAKPVYDQKGDLIGVATLGLSLEKNTQAFAEIIKSTLIEVMLSSLVIAGLLLYIINKLLAPLKSAQKSLESMGEGDFTLDISKKDLERNDEFGDMTRSLEKMQENMRRLIDNVKDNALHVMESSKSLSRSTNDANMTGASIASATDQIARMATEQADHISRIVSGAHRLGNEIETTNTLVNGAYDLADQTNTLSKKGQEIMEVLLKHNMDNNTKSDQVTQVIAEVQNYVVEAETIIEIINKIASQTNLLALNASIEAARAGESGRGFAVVADEIRVLSDETAKATNNIESIIKNIQHHTGQAVHTIHEMDDTLKHQNESIESTSDIFKSTSNAIDTLGGKLSEVQEKAGVLEQGKDQIIGAMDSISATIQETSASTEEVSASMEEQTAVIEEVDAHASASAELAESMNKALSQFKI